MDMVTGYWKSQAIATATRLGIADVLADGPMDAEAIAEATNANPDAIYRLLRALASVGVFAHEGERSFTNTPMSDVLKKGGMLSMRAVIMLFATPMHWLNWGELARAIRTGQSPMRHLHGVDDPFQYFKLHPEEEEFHRNALDELSRTEIPAIRGAYDFSDIGTLVDVGGSYGKLLAYLLQTNPDMKGVLFDSPEIIEGISDGPLTEPALEGRWEAVAGDFFESVPSGGDAYVLKNVLDDWSDEHCKKILQSIRRAIAPGGRVLVMDFVVKSEPGPDQAKWVDLNMMLVANGGRERTKEEFAALFAETGFELARIVPTMMPISIVEARIAGESA
ncbi:MAG: methyltransferase [Myxococcota bacterium]